MYNLRCQSCGMPMLWASGRAIVEALISGEEIIIARCMKCNDEIILEQAPLPDDEWLDQLPY